MHTASRLRTARAALHCTTCGFLLTGMPLALAVDVSRCLACGIARLHVEPQREDAARGVIWGEFPI